MEQIFFKTAEFAALCGVTKDTLLYYDRIGLLHPERVGENGYRYYAVRQLARFDLIAALRRLDMPLAEIREYLTRRSPETMLEMLRQKEGELEQERRRVERMQGMLRELAHGISLARSVEPGEIRIENQRQEYCAVVRAPSFSAFEESVFLLHIRDLLTWARENGTTCLFPGDIVSQESLEEDSFLEDYYFCKVPAETEGWEVRTRPAGTYAVLYHRGSYETEAEACRRLRDWTAANGYETEGDLYEEDLINDATADDPSTYLLRLSLKVREKNDSTNRPQKGQQ